MYKVLVVGSIEYNTRLLESMPVWDKTSDFYISKVVYNGETALKILREEMYDVVITEIEVPGLDGMQLLRHVNQENLCSVVIIISDTVAFQYVRECILFGAFDYLKKMPDAQTLLAVLKRAREKLAINSNTEETDTGPRYPVMEEEEIIRSFLGHNEETIENFTKTIDYIYSNKKEQAIQNDLLVKKLYSNVISRIFEENKWLYHYVDIEFYRKLDYLWAGSQEGFRDFFVRKLKHLFELYNRLLLSTSDKGLDSLITYILNYPEADLRLKTAAEKLYLNYSYLSSNFAAKVGVHYNEYIVNVRMARAAYLLANTDMKIYEICSAVSYQDTNYFTRQFKKVYLMAPSEYKAASVGDDSLDYACL